MNGSTSAPPPGQWTADELMHGKAGEEYSTSAPNGLAPSGSPNKKSGRFSMRSMKSSGKKSTDPLDWGMPGHMTQEEVGVFVSEHVHHFLEIIDITLGIFAGIHVSHSY